MAKVLGANKMKAAGMAMAMLLMTSIAAQTQKTVAPTREDLEREKLQKEITKLQLEVKALEGTSGGFGQTLQLLQAFGIGSVLGGILVLLAGQSLSRVQKEKIKQDLAYGREDHDLQKRKLEQELQMKLFEALGSSEPRIRIGAVSELGQRVRDLNDLLSPSSSEAQTAEKARRERETIIRVLIAVTKHETSEDLQKHIADLIVEVLGARQANLRESPLAGFDFQGAGLTNAWWKGVDARGTDFYKAQMARSGLAGSRVSGAIFKNAVLTGATFRDASADGANFEKADMAGVKAEDANFSGAIFKGANLRGAVLKGANLSHAQLNGAKLQGVDLQFVNLEGADLTGIETDGATKFPEIRRA